MLRKMNVCLNCGGVLLEDGSCPGCGWSKQELPSYSESVAYASASCMAHEQIGLTRELLGSVATDYPDTHKYISPIINSLDKIEETSIEQDKRIATLEKTQKDFENYRKALEDYKILVDSFEEEPKYQDFLKRTPNILNPNVKQSFPKFPLAGELIPDFLLILHDSTHIFVEIEKPAKKIFNKDGTESSVYRSAFKQVRAFVTWAGDELDHLRKRMCPNINNNNIRGMLVIGHSRDLTEDNKKALERINYEYRGLYEIKTFDQLYYDRLSNLENIGWGALS